MANRFNSQKPKGGKRIVAPEPPVSTDNQPPIFCLKYIQNDFCISKCERDEKASFADTLYVLSRQTWVQLIQRNRHHGGFEKIPQNQIKAGVPDVITPETNLIAFRFDGLKAMVGFRSGSVFHILWLDRAFVLYKH